MPIHVHRKLVNDTYQIAIEAHHIIWTPTIENAYGAMGRECFKVFLYQVLGERTQTVTPD